jgi:carboxylate-amine ligase
MAGQPSGLSDVLLNPVTGLPEPAAAVTNTLLEHLSEALAEAGDTSIVSELLTAVLARGNGATFQRNAYRNGQHLPHVTSTATAATAR